MINSINIEGVSDDEKKEDKDSLIKEVNGYKKLDEFNELNLTEALTRIKGDREKRERIAKEKKAKLDKILGEINGMVRVHKDPRLEQMSLDTLEIAKRYDTEFPNDVSVVLDHLLSLISHHGKIEKDDNSLLRKKPLCGNSDSNKPKAERKAKEIPKVEDAQSEKIPIPIDKSEFDDFVNLLNLGLIDEEEIIVDKEVNKYRLEFIKA